MAKLKRYFLYKAAKYQVEEYPEDSGFTLPKMWDVINGRTKYDADWWRNVCIADYAKEKLGWGYSLILRAQQFYR